MREEFKHTGATRGMYLITEYRNFSLNCAKFKPFLYMALTGCKVLLVLPAFAPKNIRGNIESSWKKKGRRGNPWDLMLIKCCPREFMAQPWRRCLLSKCCDLALNRQAAFEVWREIKINKYTVYHLLSPNKILHGDTGVALRSESTNYSSRAMWTARLPGILLAVLTAHSKHRVL